MHMLQREVQGAQKMWGPDCIVLISNLHSMAVLLRNFKDHIMQLQ